MQLRTTDEHEPKGRLRKLRDALASETPRARARPQVPPELSQRLEAALKRVSQVYLAAGALTGSAETLGNLCDDALVEGHLVLHEWERWLEQEKQHPKLVRHHAPSPLEQRAHERYETNISVRILRHSLRDDPRGGLTLDSAAVSRPARNISLGGMFVAVPDHEIPEVAVGGVVHISIVPSPEHPHALGMRAVVMRRTASGIGLRWILDNPREQRSINSLLDAIQRPRA